MNHLFCIYVSNDTDYLPIYLLYVAADEGMLAWHLLVIKLEPSHSPTLPLSHSPTAYPQNRCCDQCFAFLRPKWTPPFVLVCFLEWDRDRQEQFGPQDRLNCSCPVRSLNNITQHFE